jgi:hypothetical protein
MAFHRPTAAGVGGIVGGMSGFAFAAKCLLLADCVEKLGVEADHDR